MAEGNIAQTFAKLFSSPFNLATEALVFVAYWLVLNELVRYSSGGIFLIELPLWLLVLFVLTSSTLATITVAYLRLATRKKRRAVGLAQTPITVAAGTAVITCACNIPLLAPLLYFIGMSSAGVSVVISDLARWQETLVEVMIAVNVLTILYYLRLVTRAGRAGPAASETR